MGICLRLYHLHQKHGVVGWQNGALAMEENFLGRE
jgi:hypothetical protein